MQSIYIIHGLVLTWQSVILPNDKGLSLSGPTIISYKRYISFKLSNIPKTKTLLQFLHTIFLSVSSNHIIHITSHHITSYRLRLCQIRVLNNMYEVKHYLRHENKVNENKVRHDMTWQTVLYFIHIALVFSFDIDVVLTLSVRICFHSYKLCRFILKSYLSQWQRKISLKYNFMIFCNNDGPLFYLKCLISLSKRNFNLGHNAPLIFGSVYPCNVFNTNKYSPFITWKDRSLPYVSPKPNDPTAPILGFPIPMLCAALTWLSD